MKVKGICSKADFKRMELQKNGLLIVRYDEKKTDGGQMEYSEESVANDIGSVKALMKRLIAEYDTSGEVNGFTLSHDGKSIDYWLPAEKRAQLFNGVNATKASGDTVYIFDIREKGTSMVINCDVLLSMLESLEDYARKCYNTTSRHLSEVDTLSKIEDVVNYDYKSGYPEKPNFNIN